MLHSRAPGKKPHVREGWRNVLFFIKAKMRLINKMQVYRMVSIRCVLGANGLFQRSFPFQSNFVITLWEGAEPYTFYFINNQPIAPFKPCHSAGAARLLYVFNG